MKRIRYLVRVLAGEPDATAVVVLALLLGIVPHPVSVTTPVTLTSDVPFEEAVPLDLTWEVEVQPDWGVIRCPLPPVLETPDLI